MFRALRRFGFGEQTGQAARRDGVSRVTTAAGGWTATIAFGQGMSVTACSSPRWRAANDGRLMRRSWCGAVSDAAARWSRESLPRVRQECLSIAAQLVVCSPP
jgi:hypothetical protein